MALNLNMSPDAFETQIDKLKLSESSSEGVPVSAMAFLGDGVWEILVREYLTVSNLGKADKLHERKTEMVNAVYQCRAAEKIMEHLTASEKNIYIRGRNTHTAHTPRRTSKRDYHSATGLETLFGWLYLNSETDRIKELFRIAVG
ncbi:MAG: ribonuclease III [Clostridiales bacterium]|nr:ribonuclease III [Clostridiales bacterium]